MTIKLVKRGSQVGRQVVSGAGAELRAALKDLPDHAYGDPKAAASLGKVVSRSASRHLQAEAEAGVGLFEATQKTYRKAYGAATTAEERKAVLDAVERAEIRALEAARVRVDSSERTAENGFSTAQKIALGGAFAAAAIFLAMRNK